MAITEEFCSIIWNRHLNDIKKNGIQNYTDDAEFVDFKAILDSMNTYTSVDRIFKTNKNKTWKKIYENIMELFKEHTYKKIVISISGGVDSMLLSLILSNYCKFHNIELIMVHLNYNNRATCNKEIKFLVWWSKQIDCKLYVKSFDITRSRNSKERALYENLTRRIRYSVYDYFKAPIFLGHNMDDCYENVFSNLSKRIHFDNLYGMSKYSIESNIPIIRPMLDISKKDIIDISHSIGIPYLEDSTPGWSNRGKMRDILIPHIDKFNPQILPGISEFITYTTNLEKHWNKLFHKWAATNIEKQQTETSTKLIISKTDDFYCDNFKENHFWIKIWFEYDLITRPSNKSFSSMINLLKGLREKVTFELNAVSKMYNVDKETLTLTVYNNPCD